MTRSRSKQQLCPINIDEPREVSEVVFTRAIAVDCDPTPVVFSQGSIRGRAVASNGSVTASTAMTPKQFSVIPSYPNPAASLSSLSSTPGISALPTEDPFMPSPSNLNFVVAVI